MGPLGDGSLVAGLFVGDGVGSSVRVAAALAGRFMGFAFGSLGFGLVPLASAFGLDFGSASSLDAGFFIVGTSAAGASSSDKWFTG